MKRILGYLTFFVIFLARLYVSLQANQNLDQYAGRTITISGRISSQISLQGNSQRFEIGRIGIQTGLYPSYTYGDRITASGTLEKRVINRWYSRFRLMYPQIKLVKSGNNLIIGLKSVLERWYGRVLPEPEASLLAGIAWGSRRGLPEEFWQQLRQTGTLHIVVASGYNVSVVIGSAILLFSGLLKRQTAIVLGIAAVAVYSVIAGLEPAIIRAALMGSLAYFGQILGKQGAGFRLLIIAAAAMLLVNPLYLFDIGFQLSFMATLGLIIISPRLPRRLPKTMAETLSAQIMVTPLILIYFGRLSPFSIVVNSLILWLVPYAMGLSWLPWLAYVPLHLMVIVINWFARYAL